MSREMFKGDKSPEDMVGAGLTIITALGAPKRNVTQSFDSFAPGWLAPFSCLSFPLPATLHWFAQGPRGPGYPADIILV